MIKKFLIYIIYVDSNNFYGCAMIQYLETGGSKWLTQYEIDKSDVNVVTEN